MISAISPSFLPMSPWPTSDSLEILAGSAKGSVSVEPTIIKCSSSFSSISVTVTVTNFGDGTLPDYADPDNIVDPDTQNDNPISDGNHGSYWEDAAATLTDIY